MTTITVQTHGGSIACDHRQGDTLLETLQRNNIHLPAPCGGVGRCGKCAVSVSDEAAAGPRSPEEERHAPEGSGLRLACRAIPVASLTVTIGESVAIASDDVTSKGGAITLPAEGIPVVRSVEVNLAPPTLSDQRSVQRRLSDEIDATATVDLAAVRDAAQLMRNISDSRKAAGLVAAGPAGDLLVAVDAEVRETLPAVAIDIGTTTIASYLIDLASRRILAARSEENNQQRFGADVIGRISAIADGHDLTGVVRNQLSDMIGTLARSAGISPADVLFSAAVGNPTMTHILLGLDPHPIGQAPFMPLCVEPVNLGMADLELPGHAAARVIIAPGMSGYVGADIIADILTARLNEAEGLSLLIDIGTNGEMVLGNRDGIVACSTAAGPAFEGANIRCGSGGIPGAIDSVARNGDELSVTTIGGLPARTICGPGLVDLVALLRDNGVVDETGRLDLDVARKSNAYRDRVVTTGDEEALLAAGSGDGPDVVLTQGDLRQLQLAKGAIAAGVRTLLEHAGVTMNDVTRVYLAGGFGTYVSPRSALRIGLLPKISAERVVAIGNAAGAGAARLLLDRDAIGLAQRIAAEGSYIELSQSQTFQQHFIDEMLFP